jgi:elongator complex protein 1
LLVERAATVETLTLFISALRDENVVATKYRPPAHHAFHRAKPEVEAVEGWDHVSGAGKVNLICRELRAVMMSMSTDKYMLPMLTTFARESPPRLEDGLALIVEDANSKQLLLKSHHVQSNIKYFVFLVSADELFDTALGMYDFNLARAVARQSQKDPRQYQPLLEEFESIEDPVMQRYRVNLHLGRIAKALEAFSEILQKQQYKEFAEYVDLADKHELQEHALSLLPKRGTQQARNHLMLSLGNRLLKVSLPRRCFS